MKTTELRAKTAEDLQKELLALLREQSNLRFQPKEQLQSRDFRRVRRDIARVKTLLREKEIGQKRG